MANIKDVASYLVSLSQPSSPRAITPSKLQKLVYFAQGVHLRKHSQPLFTEEVFARNQGPVNLELYERDVVKEGWSEQKFTDVTYLLANNKSSFSKDNYTDYGSRYVNIDDDLMLKIRSKYEAEAKSQIDVKNEQKLANKKLEEDELLEYIANNGGRS